MTRHALLLLVATLSSAAYAQAPDASWPLCAVPFIDIKPPASLDAGSGVTRIESDAAHSQSGDGRTFSYEFSGGTAVSRGAQWLRADKITYRDDTAEGTASGAVQMGQGDLLLLGNDAWFSFADSRGRVSNAQYFLPQRHARGDAATAEIDSSSRATLSGARFTTCEVGDSAWHLHARTLTLDNANNIGVATHVWVDFMSVPFLYLPYIDFPLSGRKSGFLFPTLGQSDRLGAQVAVPYYWNIAPNMDATFTLRNFSARGQQLAGEYRYLQPTHRGELNVEVLPDDKPTGNDRVSLVVRQQWNPGPRFGTSIDYRRVSDRDYFDDFGDRLSTSNVDHLERVARAGYRADGFDVQASVLDYQTVNEDIAEADRPYRKLPELVLRGETPRSTQGVQWSLLSAATNFDRADRVSGTRVTLNPAVSWTAESLAAYARPKLGVRYTAYSLRDAPDDADEQPARTVPVFSFDSGVFFERESNLFGSGGAQTLEPRLFYLYVPYEKQTTHVFDSGLAGLSYGQLFQDNRFSGYDRDGDANQASLALTSRLLDVRGVERASASVGRIFYFRDRDVIVKADDAIQTDAYSNIVGELRAQPIDHFTATATAEYDSNIDLTRAATAQLRYQSSPRKIANLALRLARDDQGDFTQQETDLSLFWPVHRQWSVVGRRNYSMLHHLEKEWLAGIEYDSCCWALRLVKRSYITNMSERDWMDNPRYNNAVLLQLELKGLSSVGQDVQSLLENREHGITGY